MKKNNNKQKPKKYIAKHQPHPNVVNQSSAGILSLRQLIKANIPLLIALVIFAFLLYGNTLRGAFLNADDIPGTVQNPQVINLSQGLKTYNLDIIVKALIQNAFGFNPAIFHARSILLHAINSFLAFILIFYLFKNQELALWTTILFLVHSAASEAVSWISAGTYLYFGLATLITLITFVLYRHTYKKVYLVVSSVTYLLALSTLQSPWVLTIPFVVFIIDAIVLQEKFAPKTTKQWLPFIIPTLLIALFLLPRLIGSRAKDLELYPQTAELKTPYIVRLPYSVYKTVELYIAPIDLTIYHEGKVIEKPLYIIMFFFSFAFTALVLYLIKVNKKIAGLILATFATMLPVFVPYGQTWFIADRYLYTGTIFVSALIIHCLFTLEQKLKIKDFARYVFIILLICYSYRTLLRTQDWLSNKNLWISTAKTAPLSYRVYNNLGDVYSQEKDYERAIIHFKKAIEINPQYADAMHNLGFTYMQIPNYEQAQIYLQQAYQTNPSMYQAVYKLGVIEYNNKNYVEAKRYFEQTLKINPTNLEAQKGINLAEKALETKPSILANPVPTEN